MAETIDFIEFSLLASAFCLLPSAVYFYLLRQPEGTSKIIEASISRQK
jgi:hypothetical protein